MNNQMKRVIFFALAMLVTMIVSGQELQVRSFRLAANDISAVKYQRLDLNGNPCALIKVGLGVQGAKFPGTEVVGDVKFDTGEYWVYVVDGTKKLKVMHNNYAPLYIDFSDYPEQHLEGGRTYVLILVGVNSGNADKADQTESLSSSSAASNALSSDNKSSAFANVLPITVNGITFNMIKVDGGTFTMGATSEQEDPHKNEKPTHQVTLSSYYIGETEVTQELWKAVMGNNPSKRKGNNLPVERVAYKECHDFIRKLNALTNRKFRLPTEAEWEFAARGGNKSYHTQYSGSSNLDEVAWYCGNSGNKYLSESSPTYDMKKANKCKSHPVKTKKPNELGIYDMSGNVREWCEDRMDYYGSSAQTNPIITDPSPKFFRSDFIIRGGSWMEKANECRTSSRGSIYVSAPDQFSGFRLALSE